MKAKVAVITGAAEGIGKALALRSIKEGMKVVLADVEERALAATEAELREAGADIMGVVTDVGNEADIKRLAEETIRTYGGVHYLFNNAGVGAGSLLWNSTVADWQWVLNVNLWGLIHATRTFVPIMLEQDTLCHITNTASMAGLESGPGNSIYRVTKHAVVAFSETLYHELKLSQAKVGVSVLCPGFVQTKICDAERNRPEGLRNSPEEEGRSPIGTAIAQFIREGVKTGMKPDEVADIAFAAIKHKRFYILPDSQWKRPVKQRLEDLLEERNPTFVVP
ncbi:SDR family NAD(P)-dependent oxidoreductase [Brevibacillus fluminis]|uniref:SDR family NAD(P)-dependent oxidoreductase n=1 Tax=Brevibacillus fluminis TaxID=511487 RepID=UPI003F88F4D2